MIGRPEASPLDTLAEVAMTKKSRPTNTSIGSNHSNNSAHSGGSSASSSKKRGLLVVDPMTPGASVPMSPSSLSQEYLGGGGAVGAAAGSRTEFEDGDDSNIEMTIGSVPTIPLSMNPQGISISLPPSRLPHSHRSSSSSSTISITRRIQALRYSRISKTSWNVMELAIFDTDSFFAMVHNLHHNSDKGNGSSSGGGSGCSSRNRTRSDSSGGGNTPGSSSSSSKSKNLWYSSTRIFLIDSLPSQRSTTSSSSGNERVSFTIPGNVHSAISASSNSTGYNVSNTHTTGSSSSGSRYVTLEDELQHRNMLVNTWQYKEYSSFARFMAFVKTSSYRNIVQLFHLFHQQQQPAVSGGIGGLEAGEIGSQTNTTGQGFGSDLAIERGFLAFEIDQRCAFVLRRTKPLPSAVHGVGLGGWMSQQPGTWFQPFTSTQSSSTLTSSLSPVSPLLHTRPRRPPSMVSTTTESVIVSGSMEGLDTVLRDREKEREMESIWCYIYPEDLNNMLTDPMITFGQLLTQLFPQLTVWYPNRESDHINVIVKYWPVIGISDDDAMGPCCEETLLQPLPKDISLQTIGSLNAKAVTIVPKLALVPAYHNFILEYIT